MYTKPLKLDRQIKTRLEPVIIAQKVVLAVDHIGGFGGGLVFAPEQPLVVDPVDEAQEIAVLAADIELGIDTLGDVEAREAFALLDLVRLDTGDVLALGERGDGGVVVEERYLAVLFDIVGEHPGLKLLPGLLDIDIVPLVADIEALDARHLDDGGLDVGEIRLRAERAFGLADDLFGVLHVAAVAPLLGGHIEPPFEGVDKRRLRAVAAFIGNSGDGRVAVGHEEVGRLLEADRLDALVDVLAERLLKYPVHMELAHIEVAAELLEIDMGLDVGVDIVHDIVGYLGSFLEYCSFHSNNYITNTI